MWIEGLRSYFLDWWNCLDVMVLGMYLASFALRLLIMLKGLFVCHGHDVTEECAYFTQAGEKMFQRLKYFICHMQTAVVLLMNIFSPPTKMQHTTDLTEKSATNAIEID